MGEHLYQVLVMLEQEEEEVVVVEAIKRHSKFYKSLDNKFFFLY